MNYKILLLLLALTILYAVFGGVVFHYLEAPREEKAQDNIRSYIEYFSRNFTCLTPDDISGLLQAIEQAYDNGVEVTNTNKTSASKWDFASSIFFSVTVITTIGFGNIAPITPGGRVFCAFYSFIGIPLFLVTCAGIGDKLRVASNKLEEKLTPKKKRSKWIKTALSLILFQIGFVLFAIIPASIFQRMESWSFADSMYFIWITLTTIGFGDFVPDITDLDTASLDAAELSYNSLYRIAVTVWIFIGLTWMAGVISTVQDIFSEAASKVQQRVVKEDESEQDSEQLQNENTKEETV